MRIWARASHRAVHGFTLFRQARPKAETRLTSPF